jgi:hypothetical protein
VVKGEHHAEYTWFSVADSLPLLTISAKKAAQKIVRAVRTGKAEVTLGFPAKLLAFTYGHFPVTVIKSLAVANHLLLGPDDAGGLDRSTGRESQTSLSKSFLTTLSKRAARTYNENSALE